MWPSASFDNYQRDAIFLSTPISFFLWVFFWFYSQKLQYVHRYTFTHISAYMGGALCITSEEHVP